MQIKQIVESEESRIQEEKPDAAAGGKPSCDSAVFLAQNGHFAVHRVTLIEPSKKKNTW